jgi:hypothetical protein
MKGDVDQFKYWDATNYAREQYRYLTNTTFSGEMAEVRRQRAVSYLYCYALISDADLGPSVLSKMWLTVTSLPFPSPISD